MEDIYKDPRYGLYGKSKMRKKIKNQGHKIKNIDKKIENLPGFQVSRRRKKHNASNFYRIDAKAPAISVQFDILDLHKYQSKRHNANVRYLLIGIDVYSRHIFVKTLTRRTHSQLEPAMVQIFEEIYDITGRYPQHVTVDNEFGVRTSMMKNLKNKLTHSTNEYDFKHHVGDPHQKFKTQLVERVNFTIRSLIQRYMELNNTISYVNVLPEIVENYNNTEHRSIGITPHDAIHKNKARVFSKEYHNPKNLGIQKYQEKKDQQFIGKFVRFEIPKKNPFEKSDTIKYSREIYKVSGKVGLRYQLTDAKTGVQLEKLYAGHQLLVVGAPTNSTFSNEKLENDLNEIKKKHSRKRRIRNYGLDDRINDVRPSYTYVNGTRQSLRIFRDTPTFADYPLTLDNTEEKNENIIPPPQPTNPQNNDILPQNQDNLIPAIPNIHQNEENEPNQQLIQQPIQQSIQHSVLSDNEPTIPLETIPNISNENEIHSELLALNNIPNINENFDDSSIEFNTNIIDSGDELGSVIDILHNNPPIHHEELEQGEESDDHPQVPAEIPALVPRRRRNRRVATPPPEIPNEIPNLVPRSRRRRQETPEPSIDNEELDIGDHSGSEYEFDERMEIEYSDDDYTYKKEPKNALKNLYFVT